MMSRSVKCKVPAWKGLPHRHCVFSSDETGELFDGGGVGGASTAVCTPGGGVAFASDCWLRSFSNCSNFAVDS